MGVCPATMMAFMDETGEWVRQGPNIIANKTRYIINDFTTHPNYMHRPYVVGFPWFRSYLEVPLVSPLGYLLGSYCVVDSKQNEFDNDETMEIMNEITAAIMAHLELKKMQQSRNRSEQLIQGLSDFVGHGPATPFPPRPIVAFGENRGPENTVRPSTDQPAESETNTTRTSSAFAQSEPDQGGRPVLSHAASSIESALSMSSPTEQRSETPPTTPREEVVHDPMAHQGFLLGQELSLGAPLVDASAPPQSLPTPASESPDSSSHAKGFLSSANVKSIFFRAAHTIRQSMNMNGLMFVDAVPSAYIDRSDQAHHSLERDAYEEVTGPFCSAIVQSCDEASPPSPHIRLPEAVLQRFIRRFPHGHVFSADEFGPIEETYGPGKPWPGMTASDSDNAHLRSDVATLFRALPPAGAMHAAKYIIFLPMWHFQRECWYAAALGWVTDPIRAIDVGDINLVAAFGNSVMAEVSRMEAMAASRAKSDFVSSLSHELRSPLHGIMASSELLREGIAEPELLSILDMLVSCGTTLLDTFNNLLDHAVVTSSGGRSRASVSDVRTVDLGGLVEEVVDAVHISHLSENVFQSSQYRRGPYSADLFNGEKKVQHRPLIITINIGKRPSWVFPVSVGSWKRIVMNLFSNALKYTNTGGIEVSLKVVQRQDKAGKPREYICFSVQDTGRGISSDYLKYQLFTPFSQENTHAPGMGLGLSIVQQLAASIGGTVNVKSTVGVGTYVEILAPLPDHATEAATENQAVAHAQPAYDDNRCELRGRTACLITPEAYVAMGKFDVKITSEMESRSARLESAFKIIADETFGMKVVTGTADRPCPEADVYVLDANIVQAVSEHSSSDLLPTCAMPLVFLCSGAGPPSCLKHQAAKSHGIHLHHPMGPRRLASVLCSALKRASCATEDPAAILPDPRPLLLSHLSLGQRADTPPPRAEPQVQQKEVPSSQGDDSTGHGSTPPVSLPPAGKPIELRLPTKPLATTPLPIAPVHVTPLPPKRAISTPDATILASGPKCHVLVVDDNIINQKILTVMMKRNSHTFATANNGLEAVQLYEKSLESGQPRFDLIFMDISMPVMDGFEATRQIRLVELEKGIERCCIVAVTAHAMADRRNEMFASGCDDFVTKPVTLGKIKEILDHKVLELTVAAAPPHTEATPESVVRPDKRTERESKMRASL